MKLYSFIRFWVLIPIRLLFGLKIEGRKNIPEGAFVVCSNHTSAIDPVLLAVAFPKPIRFIGKAELLDTPVMRAINKITCFIPITRGTADLKAIRTCIDAVKGGQSIGIFPQGTRMHKKPETDEALPGTGLIIMRTKAPVVPVAIITKNHKAGMLKTNRIVIGKPISYEEYSASGNSEGAAKYCFARVCERFE